MKGHHCIIISVIDLNRLRNLIFSTYNSYDSRDSSPDIATSPVAQGFSFLQSFQTDPGAHLVSYSMDRGALSTGVKRPGREADHSSPSTAEVKKDEAIPQFPHMSSWHSA
jgi:hypothetical protein